MSRILILGGDGYLGWPTAMYFSDAGHEVTVVDNYMRRHAADELNTGMLYPVPTLQERAKIWHEITGKEIKVIIGDLAEPSFMRSLFNGTCSYTWSISSKYSGPPETVVHYAEQPSAPYSIYNYQLADFTLINNLRVTNNLVWAVKDFSRDTHIVKLGTMGEYGTPNIDIEEGWLDVKHNGREQKFLYPRQASSLYHTTKIMDTDLLWFAVRTWDLAVTDLMQGPVYGISTPQIEYDDRLKTIFNYDEIFGTLVNRFVVQSVTKYPLTVYGRGDQTRGYLNINDTLQCVDVASKSAASPGELKIFNQIMETFSVNELANIIKDVGCERGHDVKVESVDNPRKEAEEHYYNPSYQALLDMGVKPHYLTKEMLHQFFEMVEKYSGNIRRDTIFNGIKWD